MIFGEQCKAVNKYLGVRFDANHNKIIGKGIDGQGIIRADEWLHKDDDGKQTFQENMNYLETKPQICEVLAANDRYPYKVGDKLFVHYMAWETAQCGDLITNEAVIIADYVFFTILSDGKMKMAENNYLGKQLYTDDIITKSGIFLQGGRPKSLQIRITNMPLNLPKWHIKHPVNIGDTVISCDGYNYEFKYEGEKYIRLKDTEIAGVIREDRIDLIPN